MSKANNGEIPYRDIIRNNHNFKYDYIKWGAERRCKRSFKNKAAVFLTCIYFFTVTFVMFNIDLYPTINNFIYNYGKIFGVVLFLFVVALIYLFLIFPNKYCPDFSYCFLTWEEGGVMVSFDIMNLKGESEYYKISISEIDRISYDNLMKSGGASYDGTNKHHTAFNLKGMKGSFIIKEVPYGLDIPSQEDYIRFITVFLINDRQDHYKRLRPILDDKEEERDEYV